MDMKTKLILLLIVLLASCSPAKKVTKTDVTQKLQSNNELKNENSTKESGELKKNNTSVIDSSNIKALQLFENWKKNYQANTKVYDTNKPIVPGTNRPPLASETTISNIESNDKNLQENSNTKVSKSEIQQIEANFKKKYDSKLDSITKENTSLKSEVTEKTTQANNWSMWFLAGISICILFQLAWKFTPLGKLSFIWQKIKNKFAVSNK